MATNTAPTWLGQRSLGRNISFLLMWSSVAASGFGDRVMMVAALTLMGGNKEGIDGTSVNAGISFFFFLPYLLLGLPAGWLADRLPRKWIMLGCDESRAAMLLLAFFLVPTTGAAAIGLEHHWRVLAVIGAVGVFAAIFNPARNATIPQIVPASQLQKANALILGIAVIASMVGMGVSAVMFDPQVAASTRTGLLVGFLFFAVSGTFFAFLKIRPRSGVTAIKRRPGSRSSSTLAYVASHGATWKLILINMIVWGAAMVVYNAALGLCKQRYGFAPQMVIGRYMVMSMAIGLGMLCGAGSVAWMNTRRESPIVAMATLLGAGVCTALLASSRGYGFGLAMALGVGFFGNVTMICVATLLQAISPNYIRGRIMGLNTLATTIAMVGVNFVIWQMANADMLIITILKVTAAVLSAVALWGLWRQMATGPTPTRQTNIYWRTIRLFVLIWHRLRWIGRQHVPSTGPVILAANHTTALDPMLIQAAVPRVINWVMLKEFQSRGLWFLWQAIKPIALERGGRDLSRMRQILSVLDAGQVVGFFPEGGLQRDRRELRPFGRGIGMLASRSKAVIVPIWITGTPCTRRMIWHFLKPSHSQVIIGAPYRPHSSMNHQQVADDLRQRLEALSQSAND